MKALSIEELGWVERTLAGMSIEERVGQMLIPTVHGNYDGFDEVRRTLERIPLGGVFTGGAVAARHREKLAALQAASRVPLIIAADLECGAGHVVEGATPFPDPLAVAASDDAGLARTMGEAAAREGRAVGIHWTFAPVVDVNVNPDNPIANTRSLGDRPERVGRLAGAILRGMQEHGLAACAKHFPGDGVDDLDQHTVTSVNSLSIEDWKRISGRPFLDAIAAGVWSVMVGHIALPAWDSDRDRRGCYRPASVSRRLVTDLLRNELGFQGLVVTDDMNMGGVAGYLPRRERTIACIAAGCDMLLFPWLPGDFEVLVQAVRNGELSEARVTDAARRVLELKARLGLSRSTEPTPEPSSDDRRRYEQSALEIAERAVVKVRDLNGTLPLRDLKPGARVLTITLSMETLDVPHVDEALRARGYTVDHLLNPSDFMLFCNPPVRYDAIFVNLIFRANWAYQSVRSVGVHNRIFIGGFYSDHPRVVFTSFGSPYHLRMFNTWPNLVNAHTALPASQRAAVRFWFGESDARGSSPVGRLEREPVRA